MKNCIILVGLLACAGCSATNLDVESRDFVVQKASISPAEDGAPDIQGINDLVKASGPTYVTLVISKPEAEDASSGSEKKHKTAVTSGSGFVVDSSGYVMTAGHVAVKKGNSVSARAANGRVYSGKVVSVLPANDMALIKLNNFSGRAVMPAPSQCVAGGAMVYSLGKPQSQGDTARVGKLESMHFGRSVAYGQFGYPDAMVLSMNTQKGESGGPLFDRQGQLVGMVVSTLFDDAGQPLNLAHAVYSSSVADFLCSQTDCGKDWRQLAGKSPNACPKS